MGYGRETQVGYVESVRDPKVGNLPLPKGFTHGKILGLLL
jgi:hypothetical protein